MAYNYWDNFPVPASLLPERLQSLLRPVGLSPQERVELTTLYEQDKYGPSYEYVRMLMAVVPDDVPEPLPELQSSADGTVAFSTPSGHTKGFAKDFSPSMDGYEYLVASWGNSSWYSYNLAEKVWMALGLSPRCVGNEHQTIIYDDLSLPEFGVAEGIISSEHYWRTLRNINWQMSNEYLRRYLWMRGARGVRAFFYEAAIAECPELRDLMGKESQLIRKSNDGWCSLDIREYASGLLIQVWATVTAVSCELCPEQRADGLKWPDIEGEMTHARANSLISNFDSVVLDDRFLEKYEQNNIFDCNYHKIGNSWDCSPSYKGQWSFTDCTRVGRNLVRVRIRELYKGKPDREILHSYKFALSQEDISHLDLDEEHIVSKVHRLVNQLLDLGDNLSRLGRIVGVQKEPHEIVKLSRKNIKEEGWRDYPHIRRLAQVAPLDMTQQAFLSRCKTLHELYQSIPVAFLKEILKKAGCPSEKVNSLGNLKLLQGVFNIVDDLNSREESQGNFVGTVSGPEWENKNQIMSALFINYDLRIADAHEAKGDILPSLQLLGFDTARVNSGYGYALDFIVDKVIATFEAINTSLRTFLER